MKGNGKAKGKCVQDTCECMKRSETCEVIMSTDAIYGSDVQGEIACQAG